MERDTAKRIFRMFLPLWIALWYACQDSFTPQVQKIIQRCVERHGGERYERFRMTFDFRQFRYDLRHDGGRYRYARAFRDSAGAAIEDVLTNESFTRKINGQVVRLDSSDRQRYTNAVNSVAYFVLLPHKLLDPAVQAEVVPGEHRLDGHTYHKLRVSFRPEGGGQDYQDVFYFWIDRDIHSLDYLAYSEGGNRFRKAVNPQVVGGIVVQDYLNFQGPKDDTTDVGQYDHRYRAGGLTLLSRIEQKNVRVSAEPGF
jgi:hypothetical protein